MSWGQSKNLDSNNVSLNWFTLEKNAVLVDQNHPQYLI